MERNIFFCYCHTQLPKHQQLSLCQSWKCVPSSRKWNGDRPLQKSHFVPTVSLADISQLGWVGPLDWHGRHNAELHHSKWLSLTLSRTITGFLSCHPAKCCYMYPIQTSQAWRDGKPLEQKDTPQRIQSWHTTYCWLVSKWPFGGRKLSLERRREEFLVLISFGTAAVVVIASIDDQKSL